MKLRKLKSSTKKLLSILLSLCTLFSIATSVQVTFASTNGHTQTEAINWLNSKVGIQVGDGQCPALAKAYYSYLGYSVSGNGKDYEYNIPSGWQRTYYYSGFVPQPGDIAVWRATNTSAGAIYGHVAIVKSGTSSSMVCYEQGNSAGLKVRTNNYSYGMVTCFIRPDFSGGSTISIIKPTISLNKTSYNVGESVTINWSHSASNSNLSHYWIIIDYNNSPYINTRINSNQSSYSFTPSNAGTYYIKMQATPTGSQNGEGSLSDERYINVTSNSLVKPTITLNQSSYNTGEKVVVTWTHTSLNSNLSHYWIVIDYNNSPYINQRIDVSAQEFSFTPTNAGTYYIKMQATPVGSQHGEGSLMDERYLTVNIPHTHSYTSNITKTPTCTENGIKTYTCSCGDYYIRYIEYNGHKSVSSNNAVKPTCTTAGKESDTKCSVCGVKLTTGKTLSATGHKSVSSNNAVAPTCTKAGRGSDTVCSVCGIKLTTGKTISATGHSYTTKVINPTYSAKGYTLHTCSVCKSSYKDNYTNKLTVAKPTVSKVTSPKSKQIKVTWGKKSYTGYQVQIATDSKFTKNKKSVTIKKASTVSTSFTKLKGKTKYYVRVRAYKTYNGKNYYSSWSSVKSVTTKK